jgi:hypothetical protein
MHRKDPQERFWEKVDRLGDCWLWTSSLHTNGYGLFTLGGKSRRAHQLAWEWHHERVRPQGMVVMHTCDERRCVRPDHLRLGTQLENIEDRRQKGRSCRGEGSPRARLNASAVQDIRRLLDAGISQSELGRQYGVTSQTISAIALGQAWRHV